MSPQEFLDKTIAALKKDTDIDIHELKQSVKAEQVFLSYKKEDGPNELSLQIDYQLYFGIQEIVSLESNFYTEEAGEFDIKLDAANPEFVISLWAEWLRRLQVG